MFFGLDGKTPVTSQEYLEQQLELMIPLLDNLGPGNPVTTFFIEEEDACSTNYCEIDYPISLPTGWNSSPLYLDYNFSSSSQTGDIGKRRDGINFWNLLVATVQQTPFLPYPGETIDILDVGCGQALDAVGLHAYFGNSVYPYPGKSVTYTGIDIDKIEIAKAIYINKERPDLRFCVADATDLAPVTSTMPQEVQEEGFDVIVIRHQNASKNPDVWRAIFSEAWDRLIMGGILFFTSYTCIEHDIMLDIMLGLGATPLLNGHNPHAEMLLRSDNSTGLLKRDNYVAIFWKDSF